jgi:tetratricopeptide (TPR) repeat protein
MFQKYIILGTSFLLLSACSAKTETAEAPTSPAPSPSTFAEFSDTERNKLTLCGVDAAEFERLMTLDQQAFDQDMTGGWRAVSYEEGCNGAAISLLEAYVARHDLTPGGDSDIIFWHTGQLLATEGDYDAAIAYFEKTYEPEDNSHGPEWNYYVDGTIAFLRQDRPKLIKLRDQLAKHPVSEDLKASRQKFLDDNPNVNMPDGFVDQPMNLNVMNDFISCFGQPYSEAYGKCEAE